MRKITVAMLAPYLTESKRSGSVEHIAKTIKYLKQRDDIKLHIFVISYRNFNFVEDNAEIHTVKKSLPYPICLPSLLMNIINEINKVNPDIIHAEGTFIPYSTVAAILRKKYPVLLTVMGFVSMEIMFYKGMRKIQGVLLNKPNEKYVLSKIPHIIVQSSYIKDFVCKLTDSKIHIIPEGIEFVEIQDTLPCAIDERIDIFIAVSLVYLKGVDILIKATEHAKIYVPDIKVYIAGSGKEQENLQKLTEELGLRKNIKFLGYLSNEADVNRYYKACKLVVVPSRWDMDPFAPLNAAASGKPAIVSDKCNSSIIENGKTGFIFKSEDVEDLSEKIVMLLTNDALMTRMSQESKERAKEYDWKNIINRKVELYNEVISEFNAIKS